MMFSKEYSIDFERSPGPGVLHLKYVESHGSDLDALLSNAMISLETDHGNEGPDRELGDLPDDIISIIERDMTEALQDAADYAAEDASERLATVRELSRDSGRAPNDDDRKDPNG